MARSAIKCLGIDIEVFASKKLVPVTNSNTIFECFFRFAK